MYNYSNLLELLNQNNISLTKLSKILGISSRTIVKINHSEKVNHLVLDKIAEYFNCDSNSLYVVESDNKILQTLRDEKKQKLSGRLYHMLQISMTYNSNHIEGTKLTYDETKYIFETKTICNINSKINDVIETVNHFRAIDYVIDHAEEELNEEFIKEIHKILKTNTDFEDNYVYPGEYKKLENVIGNEFYYINTSKVEDVSKDMNKILTNYHSIKNINLEEIINFHVEFEKVHPFQDGNGRVGRLIILKECLKNNIIPFVIKDEKKYFYYRGLKEWNNQRGYLIDTCLDAQDEMKQLLKQLKIEY